MPFAVSYLRVDPVFIALLFRLWLDGRGIVIPRNGQENGQGSQIANALSYVNSRFSNSTFELYMGNSPANEKTFHHYYHLFNLRSRAVR
jgi:hypothetical protein